MNANERAAAMVRDSLNWMRVLPEWLIHGAALLAPPDLSARLEEEWRADLTVESATTFSRWRFALGCCWAAGVILWQHRPEILPVACVVIRPKSMIGFTQEESGIFASRSLTFFLFAGLHVLLFYVIMTGLAVKLVNIVPSSLHARLVQSLSPSELMRPLSLPQLSMSTLEISTPDFPAPATPAAAGHVTQREKSRWP